MGTEGLHEKEAHVALFLDVDNIWIACRESDIPFRASAIRELGRREGTVMVAKAYGDWSEGYLSPAKRELYKEVFELVQLPSDSNGKNTADIQLALDALEIALSPTAPNVIVLASGDRDFVPLANKLRRYKVRVIGVAVEGSVSPMFKEACDAYFDYQESLGESLTVDTSPVSLTEETVVADSPTPRPETKPHPDAIGSQQELNEQLATLIVQSQVARERESLRQLLVKSLASVVRLNQPPVGTAVNLMMTRLDNSFSLTKGGYHQFRDLVEDCQSEGLITVIHPIGPGDLRLSLTEIGRSILGYLPEPELTSPEDYAKAYNDVLVKSKVSLIPWPWRQILVKELYDYVQAEAEFGVSLRDMTTWIAEQASRQHGLSYDFGAYRKLTFALNLAVCFKDKYGYEGQHDEDMPLSFGVDPEEAIDRIDARYVNKVRIDDPTLPIQTEGIAMWLYGALDEESMAKANRTLGRATRPRSG